MKKFLKKCAFFLDMKRRNKFITFFALLFIAVYFCMPSVEVVIKKLVHQYGSQITGTDVNIKKVNVKFSAGEAKVRGITIANPKDYKSKNLFSLNEIGVKINISSLTDDTIIIDKILIDNPVITYEMLSLTQNNVSDILDNIKKNTASADKKEKEAAEKKSSDKTSKKVIIKSLEVVNGQIEIMAGVGSFKKPITLPLPKIEMKNIGEDKKGAGISETISSVLKKILSTATETVTTSGLKDLGNQATEGLKKVGNEAVNAGKNAVNEIKNMFK